MDSKAYWYEIAFYIFQATEDARYLHLETLEEMEVEYAYQDELTRESEIVWQVDADDHEMFLNVDRYYNEQQPVVFNISADELFLSFEMGHF
jgi:sporulation-control protein spo0M